MLWMVWIADLVEGINPSASAVGLQRNAKVNHGINGGVADSLPFLRDGIPSVLCVHVVPIWSEGRSYAGQGPSGPGEGKLEEHRELEVNHSYRDGIRVDKMIDPVNLCGT